MHLVPVVFLFILLGVCTGLSIVNAQAERSGDSPNASSTVTQQSSSQASCGFSGNTDLYGIGIRLGYYLQALATWMANWLTLEEARSLRPLNTLFNMAMLVAVVFLSITPSENHAVEIFVILQLYMAFHYIGATDNSKWSEKHWDFEPIRGTLNLALLVVCITYNVWFWWVGIVQFKATPCGTYIWFFWKVDMYDWYRWMLAVLSIVALATLVPNDISHRIIRVSAYRIQKATPSYYEKLAESLKIEGKEVSPERGSISGDDGNMHHAQVQTHPWTPKATPKAAVGFRAGHSPEVKAESPSIFTFRINFREADTSSSQRLESPSKHNERVPQSPVQPDTTGTEEDLEHTSSSRATVPTFAELLAAEEYVSATLHQPQLDILYSYTSPTIPGLRLVIYHPTSCLRQLLLLPRLQDMKRIWQNRSIAIPMLSHAWYSQCSSSNLSMAIYHLVFLRQAVEPLAAQKGKATKISPRALHSILAFRIAALSSTVPTGKIWARQYINLAEMVRLVLSIELVLWWNEVQGVNSVTSIGQMIPLFLGVGGLVKVVWAWACDSLYKSEDSSVVEGSPLQVKIEECSDVYYALKEAKKRGFTGS